MENLRNGQFGADVRKCLAGTILEKNHEGAKVVTKTSVAETSPKLFLKSVKEWPI